ncbi:MAG: TauD/TfdA family dioxygenase [Pseudomonadota bacterium]
MAGITHRPLSPAVGIAVDLDLESDLTDARFAELAALFRRYHLLLFRGQDLSEATQVDFSRRFGPISKRNPAQGTHDTVLVSNVAPGGVLGQGLLHFHSDNTFFAEPLKAIGLYAIEVPESGGDTLFSNAFLVYERLPAALKARVEGLSSHQLFDYHGDYNLRPDLETAPKDAQQALHPLVWRDPDSGQKALFLSEHTTAAIPGLSRDEEEELIGELRNRIADPAVLYRHHWRPGDFLFWNNVALQHARDTFDPTARRTLRRTPVLDPEGARRFPHSRDLRQPATRLQSA